MEIKVQMALYYNLCRESHFNQPDKEWFSLQNVPVLLQDSFKHITWPKQMQHEVSPHTGLKHTFQINTFVKMFVDPAITK